MTQKPPSPLYLGIDFGTSGCRAIVIDDAGEIQGIARQALPAPIVEGKRVSQDPMLWKDGLHVLFDQLLTAIDLSRIVAMSIDGTSGTVLLVDESGEPLTTALMYSDADNTQQAAQIAALAPDDSGAHGNSSGLAKLMSLSSTLQGPARAITQADWLMGCVSGDFRHSDENNVLKLGYDPNVRQWPEWIADVLDTKRIALPQVHEPGSVIGTVSKDFAQRAGINDHVRVVTGTTDSIASFLATGVSKTGEAVTTLGSTLVVKLLSDKPVFNSAYGVYSHRLGDQWLVGGASNAGCAILKQFFTAEQINMFTAQMKPDSLTGLHYYPLSRKGERFPFADAEKMPVLEPRPDDDGVYFQAILEGLTAIEKASYLRLEECGAPYPTRILSAGGGSINQPWTQMRAAAMGIDVASAKQSEAAYGSALLARKGYQNGQ